MILYDPILPCAWMSWPRKVTGKLLEEASESMSTTSCAHGFPNIVCLKMRSDGTLTFVDMDLFPMLGLGWELSALWHGSAD